MSEALQSKAVGSYKTLRRAVKKHPEVLIVGVILILVPIIFGPPASEAFDPKPQLPANEDNRVYHEKGFSIIKPAGWLDTHYVGDEKYGDAIVIYPEDAQKYSPSLVVTKYAGSEELEEIMLTRRYRTDRFMNFEAVVFSPQNGPFLSWMVGITKNFEWYKIELLLPNGTRKYRYKNVPNYWYTFLNSFEIGSKEAEEPAK